MIIFLQVMGGWNDSDSGIILNIQFSVESEQLCPKEMLMIGN